MAATSASIFMGLKANHGGQGRAWFKRFQSKSRPPFSITVLEGKKLRSHKKTRQRHSVFFARRTGDSLGH